MESVWTVVDHWHIIIEFKLENLSPAQAGPQDSDRDHPGPTAHPGPALVRPVEQRRPAHPRRAGQDLDGASHPPAHRRYPAARHWKRADAAGAHQPPPSGPLMKERAQVPARPRPPNLLGPKDGPASTRAGRAAVGRDGIVIRRPPGRGNCPARRQASAGEAWTTSAMRFESHFKSYFGNVNAFNLKKFKIIA